MTFYTPDRRHVSDAARRAGLAGGAGAPLAREARFSRWDGSQAVPDLTADEIVDALADDLVEEGDLGEALRRLMERGWRSGDPARGDMPGLEDAVRRLGALDAADGAAEPALVASGVEFLLEGLHLQRRLNKDRGSMGVVYRR